MPAERSTRSLIAAVLFILALFIAINYLVDQRPINDWWLPLALFGAGILFTVVQRPRRTTTDEIPGGARAYTTVREYTFDQPAAAPALTPGEQAGEVNVTEPRDEEESQHPIAAPETLTPAEPESAGEAVEVEAPAEEVIAAPETLSPPEPPEETTERTQEERVLDDLDTAGSFAPPSTAEGALNPPTESDEPGDAVVQIVEPVQQKDPARSEMPLSEVQPEMPERTQEERLREDDVLIQPRDTAENEYSGGGEHVAANMPTQSAPPPQTTTGERMGEGHGQMPPAQKEVMDATSAPVQPTDKNAAVEPTRPEVADAVMSGQASDELQEGIAPSDYIETQSASQQATATTEDDLTVISGIGTKMASALRNAGITSFTKLAMASDDEIRAAIEAAGMRFAPTLSTWREQATFLARGDRAGFEALLNSMRKEGHDEGGDD